jgi:raffinose/stachyose/melibiose transport system substrate-binding protein
MKNHWKKALSAALACMITVSATACSSGQNVSSAGSTATGSSTGSKDIKTLSLLMYTDWYKDGWKALEKYIADNPTEAGFKLDIQKIAGGSQGDQVIETKFASDDLPDLLETYNPQWVEANANGLDKLVDLTGIGSYSEYDDKLMDGAYKYKGKLYGMPIDSGVLSGMFYNKKVFQELNLTVPKTWNELLSVCGKIKSSGKNITPVFYSAKDEWTVQVLPLVGLSEDQVASGLNHTDFMGKINKDQIHFADCKNFTNLVGKGKELIDKGYINKTYLSDTYDNAQAALANGKAAMYPLGTWVMDQIVSKYPDKVNDIGAFALPTESGKGLVNRWIPYCLSVTTKCSDVEAGKKAVNFIASSKAQQIYADAQPGIYMNTKTSVKKLSSAARDLVKVLSDGKSVRDFEELVKYSYGDFGQYMLSFYTGTYKSASDVTKAMDTQMSKNAQAKGDTGWK